MTWTLPLWWRRLSPRLRKQNAPDSLPPIPGSDPPVCIIGDVHGCAAALDRMLGLIAARPDGHIVRLIQVGDMIDRGPDSAGVLRRFRALCADTPDRVICLMGNHERMCLDVLDDPATIPRWLMNGGDATLASFGISARRGADETDTALWHALLADKLRAALPPGTEDWLRALPMLWHEDGLAVAHAAGDPSLPLAEQPETALLWGTRRSRRWPHLDNVWMVHGHWITDTISPQAGHIPTDTGAWRGGDLSAVWIGATGLEVLSVPGGD
ncbi:MAG: metallophosphoesterase [Pseudooceanicola sp.]